MRVKHLLQQLPGWSVSRNSRWAWRFLLWVGILAVIGPWIANEKPYYCKLDGISYYPMFTSVSESGLSALHPAYAPVDWQTTSFESVWRAPIPYSHYSIDLKSGANLSPFKKQKVTVRMRHWLGTDTLGRDVLAGIIRGCRVSLLIGLGSMFLALCIGVVLGSIAAYWGNRSKRISWLQFWIMVFMLTVILLIVWMPLLPLTKWIITFMLFGIGCVTVWKLDNYGKKSIAVPADQLVMGAVTIIDGFPAMFLIIILVAILPFKGWLMILLVIALLRWPIMARYMRAEVFKMRELHYIQAAQIINLPSWKIITRHIIPYAIRPVIISFIFGVASAILAESSLSFLGIGLPPEQMNWGRLLAQSRTHFDAWWLVFFPGLAIFLTLLSLYVIGNAVQQQMKVREV
jgi:peptide/nickel transport system permease protein